MKFVINCLVLCLPLTSCKKLFLMETRDTTNKNATEEGQDYNLHDENFKYWNRPPFPVFRLENLKTEVDGMLDASIKAETKLKQELVDIIDEVDPSEDPDPDTDRLLSRLDRTIDKIDIGTEEEESGSGHSQENLAFLFESEIFRSTIENGKNALSDLRDEIHHLRATRALLERTSGRRRNTKFLAHLERMIESRMEKIDAAQERSVQDLTMFDEARDQLNTELTL